MKDVDTMLSRIREETDTKWAIEALSTTRNNAEEWRVIPGLIKYEASSLGQIRNRETSLMLRQRKDDGGYMRVNLTRGQQDRVTRAVHRLIALTFLSNPESKLTVNHKNHVRDDNSVDNLEWATTLEQNRHKRKRETQEHYSSSTRKIWRCNPLTGERLDLFDSVKVASLAVMGSKKGMTKIVAVAGGRKEKGYTRHTAFKYKWEYHMEEIAGEIWKDVDPQIIKGVEGYQVSSEGRIRNRTGRIGNAYPIKSAESYLWFSISSNQYLAHIIVAKTFLPNFANKQCVNHKNGAKNDPRLWNLEWVTQSENCQHAHDTGLNPTGKPVRQISMLTGETIAEFSSASKAGRETGVNGDNIGSAARGQLHQAGGFFWKFIVPE